MRTLPVQAPKGAVTRARRVLGGRRCIACRAEPEQTAEKGTAPAAQGNGASTSDAAAAVSTAAPGNGSDELPTILQWKGLNSAQEAMIRLKLAFALPWRRFKDGSLLVIKLEGNIAEKKQSRLSQMTSMPAITEAIRKAAYDPRVSGIFLNIDLLGAGWAKVQELRRYLAFFRETGKPTVAYMKRGGEKEYYLATACDEIYVPPTAQLSLRGFAVQGTFLRGVLDKVGVEPQIKRIGKYKSAGDQLLRTDMSEAQREQLSALLDDIYDEFVREVAARRGKTRDEVIAMLDEGIYDNEAFKAQGWVTDLKYMDELEEDFQKRTGGKDDEVAAVNLKRYKNVSPSAFGLTGKKVIAVVRESGAITGGSQPQGGQITAEPLIAKLRSLAKNKRIAGIVLRVDSPGGDALASDLMWRQIQRLAKDKPLVATMGDVAASGGYYMAMAAPTVLAHPLTITGSVGVVTGKFNFEELFDKVGYSKEVISRGRYSEILQDYRPFNEDEARLFDESAQFAYESFRNKAAESRGLPAETMEEYAQGRVWSGDRAKGIKLVDHMGGMDTAIALVKRAAEIPDDEEVTLQEVSFDRPSLGNLISGGLTTQQVWQLLLTDPAFVLSTLSFVLGPFAAQALGSWAWSEMTKAGSMVNDGSPQVLLDDVFQSIADGRAARAAHDLIFPKAVMPSIEIRSSLEAASNPLDSFLR